jgi:hypothetical protein
MGVGAEGADRMMFGQSLIVGNRWAKDVARDLRERAKQLRQEADSLDRRAAELESRKSVSHP